MMLSCTHSSPGFNLPSAARRASFALVPVPHGERSYALPGHWTKFLEPLATPAMEAEKFHVIYLWKALRVHRLTHAPAVIGKLIYVRERQILSVIFNQKNQFPPQATSPVTGPIPGTSTRAAFFERQLGNVRDGDLAIRMQRGCDDANRGFNSLLARLYFSHMRQRNHPARWCRARTSRGSLHY